MVTKFSKARYASTGILFCFVCLCVYKPLLASNTQVPKVLVNAKGQVVLPDNSVYEGEYKKGYFHGKGKLVWKNGDSYVGEFKNGLIHGRGNFTGANNDKYTGMFKDGLYHGRGRFVASNGDVYEGRFANGRAKGKGKIVFYDGAVYKGEINGWEMHGSGWYKNRSGDLYTGNFKHGSYHGKGRFVTASGEIYTGNFADGKSNGQGKIQFRDGSKYEGAILNWLMHGKGHYITRSGESYKGEFQNGYFHGTGLYTTSTETYKGQFADGAFTGKGSISFKNGDHYKGQADNWRFHGKGEYKTQSGTTYKGNFNKGELTGIAEVHIDNGDRYLGELKNWYSYGKGELWQNNGTYFKGDFKDGRFDGEGTISYKNGDIYTGSFSNNKQHGKGRLKRKNPKGGKKSVTGWWKDGRYLGESDPETYQRTQQKKYAQIDTEAIFYQQPELLKTMLSSLKATRKSKPDLYWLGFAGYGEQDVFMKETRFAQDHFDDRLGTRGRSVGLINNHKLSGHTPLASVTNLEHSLKYIAGKMDKEDDILFLFITSHGSRNHEIDVSLAGVPLNNLPATKLASLIQSSGIKWKVIVVSSCYSGGFIETLKDKHTMILTSAKKDNVSFGCSDDADMTYFGRAFFKEALSNGQSFKQAFQQTRELVKKWEKRENFGHSEPQIWTTPAIENKLRQWRSSL